MQSLKSSINKHPVIAFFIITYGISWPLFAVALFLFQGNMIGQAAFGTIAAFGPALAGIFISSSMDNHSMQKQGLRRPAVFFMSLLLSAAIMILFAWKVRGADLQAGLIIFSTILALLPAYILSAAFSKNSVVRYHFNSLLKPRGNIIWYLVALFTFPVIQSAGYAISLLLGQSPRELFRGGINAQTLTAIGVTFLYGFLFAGGINEESGWRGFAIPHLQKKYSPLAASLIVWFFWALWHLPYDISSNSSLSSIMTNRLLFNVLWAVLFVWIFNISKGSLLAPALFHPAMNTFSEFLPRTEAATFLFIILTLYVIISERMWKKRLEFRHDRSSV